MSIRPGGSDVARPRQTRPRRRRRRTVAPHPPTSESWRHRGGGCSDRRMSGGDRRQATAARAAATSAAALCGWSPIGDSIPYNSPDDCPGCTGFVDSYADAVAAATGRTVDVANLSERAGLTLPGLLDSFDDLSPVLETADVIVVGIAHNSTELTAESPAAPRSARTTSPTGRRSRRSAPTGQPRSTGPSTNRSSPRSPPCARAADRPPHDQPLQRLDRLGRRRPRPRGGTEDRDDLRRVERHAVRRRRAERVRLRGHQHAFNGPDGLSPSGDLSPATTRTRRIWATRRSPRS